MLWIWLDDLRPAPGGFTHVRNFRQFKALLEAEPHKTIAVMHFDHDLGLDEHGQMELDGYAIIKWLAENHLDRYPRVVRVHSDNGPGADNIRTYDRFIRRHFEPFPQP